MTDQIFDPDEPTQLTGDALRKFCDLTITRAVTLMDEHGASLSLILDRLLTFSAAQAVSCDGCKETATAFHQLAETIAGGAFDHLEPIKSQMAARH